MANKEKSLPAWIWWILGLIVIALTITGKVNEIKRKKGLAEKVIVLKPGEAIPLEINNKEWSRWIDATKGFCYSHASHGLIYLFSNGKTLEVKPGETVRIKGKGTEVFRLKARTEKDVAILEMKSGMKWKTTSTYTN